MFTSQAVVFARSSVSFLSARTQQTGGGESPAAATTVVKVGGLERMTHGSTVSELQVGPMPPL